MTGVLERISSTNRRKHGSGVTLTITRSHLIGVGVLVVSAIFTWGVGMRMGYVAAKRDIAYVLETSNPDGSVALPKWRAWADQDVSYTPPADLGLIFDLTARTIPGTGGMTTGDIWNGYHARLQRAFFQRSPKRYPDVGPAPAADSATAEAAGAVAYTADAPAGY